MTSHLHHWHRNDLASTRGSASLLPQNDPCSVCGFVGSAGVTWCSVCSCTHCVACGHCPSSQTGLQGVTSHHSGPLHMAQQNSGLQQLCLGWRLSLVWLLGLTLALAAIALAGCSPCPHHSQWHTDSSSTVSGTSELEHHYEQCIEEKAIRSFSSASASSATVGAVLRRHWSPC